MALWYAREIYWLQYLQGLPRYVFARIFAIVKFPVSIVGILAWVNILKKHFWTLKQIFFQRAKIAKISEDILILSVFSSITPVFGKKCLFSNYTQLAFSRLSTPVSVRWFRLVQIYNTALSLAPPYSRQGSRGLDQHKNVNKKHWLCWRENEEVKFDQWK